ncbi:putative quinone reductase Qor [Mycolicibacterium parafortuitum]|uniref:Putative quinone reductase Qor n=1 Tax=Mycolicibacterium parafortuitum TaxID=39692 RepID=A0A7I7U8Q1_MYCPF|nr:putative quinone reductase Qor [Mycolicibacterium parafortuitum]
MVRQVILDDTRAVRIRETDLAPAGDGQVRVRVSRAGVNFWEVMQRHGRVPLPEHRVPGLEGVGVVDEVGAGVTGLAPGQRVAWSKVPGSYADFVAGPGISFVPVPDAVSDAAAAALLFQGLTAHYLCQDAWQAGRGDTAIVTAAAGGVGVLLTQLLVARGARVIGLVSKPEKADTAIRAGAATVLTYGDDVTAEVRALVPGGAAVVYDAVGAGVAEPLLGTLRPRGAMVLYGAASGREADITAANLVAGSYFLTRAAGRDYLGDPAAIAERSAVLLGLAAQGVLNPVVGAQFSLGEADTAWDALESRSTVGKLLLAPSAP